MLQISALTYRIAGRLILDQATVSVPEGARLGFVGRNGAGKTTLFRLVQGQAESEAGTMSLPKGMRIGAVAQEAPGGPETLLEVVLAADKERAALLSEAETASGERRAEIEMRLVDIEAHSAPARAATILHGLGFDSAAQARPCSAFSGGWRMRVALAAVLFAEPDLLLLDEPTNYLDLEGTLWLYDYLARYPRTAIIISHDRDLLDTCVDSILHLSEGKLTLYRGNYSSFERQKAEKEAVLVKHKVKQDLERKRLTAFIDRFKAKASKAKQAQSRVKRLEKMQTITLAVEGDVPPFDLAAPERMLSPPLLAMDDVSVGYDGKAVLSRIDVTLLPDDRIALLGSNGNGKSTFCKLLAQRLQPIAGEVVRSGKLKVGYFAQHQLDELRPAESVRWHVARLMKDMPEARIRARAGRMGFTGERADTPVERLSGGEKARLLMGLATFEGPHLLILDEPTNHLDIDSRTALVQAINDYPGAVVLVSHDRFLLEACADRFWLVAKGGVKNFDGDMDDYRRLVLSRDSAPQREVAPAAPAKPARKPEPIRPAETVALRKKSRDLEGRMEKLQAVIGKVDAAIGDGSAFRRDPAKAAALARQRAELSDALARVEEEWLETNAALEGAA